MITGAGGYIGSYLVRQALENGKAVIALDTFQNGKEGLLDVAGHRNLRILKKSIFDLEDKDLDGVSKIIHLAAIVGTEACKNNPEEALKINLDGTKRLMTLCGERRFYFANTNIGYPQGHSDETANLYSDNVYAQTKIEAEKVVLAYGGTSFRLGSVFGTSPKMRDNLLLHFLVKEAVVSQRLNEKMAVFELNVMRNFIHLRDIARAFLRTYAFHRGEAYNLCLEKHYTKKMILEKLEAGFQEVKGRDPDERDYTLSVQKARKHSGFSAFVLVEEALSELRAYYEFATL